MHAFTLQILVFASSGLASKKTAAGRKNTAGRDWLLFSQAGFVTAKLK
jgi:hypothetical protein